MILPEAVVFAPEGGSARSRSSRGDGVCSRGGGARSRSSRGGGCPLTISRGGGARSQASREGSGVRSQASREGGGVRSRCSRGGGVRSTMPPEAAVPAHDALEAAVPAHRPPEVAETAHDAPEAAVSAHRPPEAAVSAHRPPEAAVSAHRPLEAAVSAHSVPEAAVPAHVPPEAAVPTHVPPEVAVPAHVPPEGGGARSRSSRGGGARSRFPHRDGAPLTTLLKRRVPAHNAPEVAGSAHSSLKAVVPVEVPHTDVPPEAVEPIIARFQVAAPHTPLWWPLVLPWVPIPPALPQSPGPLQHTDLAPHPSPCPALPCPALPCPAVPWSGIWERLNPFFRGGGLCQESGPCVSPSRHQRSLSPGLHSPNSTHLALVTPSAVSHLSWTIYALHSRYSVWYD